MERPKNITTGNIDSTLGAQLAAKGYTLSVETPTEQDANEETRNREIELIEKSLRESQNNTQANRNHPGNGRRADKEALSSALKEAGVVTPVEREMIKNQFFTEKNRLVAEIAEAAKRAQGARAAGDLRVAHNWEIRHEKAKDILELYEEAENKGVIEGDTGKKVLESLHEYTKTRTGLAAQKLITDSFEETGKFAVQAPTETELVQEWRTTTPANINGERVIIDLKKIPVLAEAPDDELTLTRKVSEHHIEKFKGNDVPPVYMKEVKKLTPTEIISYPTPEPEILKTVEHQEKPTSEQPVEHYIEAGVGEIVETAPATPTVVETIEMTPAQEALRAGVLEKLKKISDETERRAETIGDYAMNLVRKTGEAWNKFPLRYKVLVGTGMLASGLGAAALGASTAVGAIGAVGVGMRAVGGAGMFVIFEHLLKNASEKSGKERTSTEELRHTALAATLSILIATALPGIIRDIAVADITAGQTPKPEITPGSPLETGATPLAASPIEIACAGDSIWSMTERHLTTTLGEKFTSLPIEQQTYLIDAIKDQIVAHPDQFGIENPDVIQVGQGIDFSVVTENTDFVNHTLLEAQNFEMTDSSAQEVPHEQPQHPQKEALTFKDGVVTGGSLQVTFQYGPDGTVTGYSAKEISNFINHEEAQKLLNENWKEVVRANATPGTSGLDMSVVTNNANSIYQYEQVLHTLEQQGKGAGPEATFLKEQIEHFISDTEKQYGDVFNEQADGFKATTIETTSASSSPVETPTQTPEGATQSSPAEVATYTNERVHSFVNNLFGSKGFFGFGGVDGMKTANWADFAGRPALEVIEADSNIMPPAGALDVGMNNHDALTKMQGAINTIISETGVQPTQGESVEKFLNRAAASTFGKVIK